MPNQKIQGIKRKKVEHWGCIESSKPNLNFRISLLDRFFIFPWMSNVLLQKQIETKPASSTKPSVMDRILTFANQRNNLQTTQQIQSEYIGRVLWSTLQLTHLTHSLLPHSLTRTLAITLTRALSLSLSRFLWWLDSCHDTLVVTLPAQGALALCFTAFKDI